MLSELTIENFAIIDRLLVRFEPGFTAVTGETGAGKSIIVDALQAAVGARVGSDVVRSGAARAVVEAVFDLPVVNDAVLSQLLRDNGIDDDDCLVLRREIHAAGRSTGRLNGRAVPVSTLASIGALLVDIHGQSDHLSILRLDQQLLTLDRFGDLLNRRSQVGNAIKTWGQARSALDHLLGGQREAEQRSDLLRFQVNEIESANLRLDEDEELEWERKRLANAERLAQLAESAYQSMQGESASAIDAVNAALLATHDLVAIDPALTPVDERLQAAAYELEDLAQEFRRYRDGIEYDPARLQAIEERLDLLTRLKRKYGATLSDVIAFGEGARTALQEVENMDDRISELERTASDAEGVAASLADELSTARRAAAETLTRAMREALQGLGLKSTEFHIEVAQVPADDGLKVEGENRVAYSSSGIDTVTFHVSFNPGEPLRPLERVASGGETSRFLLALKSVLSHADRIPTLIFDEVDVGVGSRAGMVVGERLRGLASAHQVLSITHLPQVAALADHHLSVSKTLVEGRTGVEVRYLERPERVNEIAEMMSGTGTDTARRTAEELLEAAQHGA